MKTILSIPLIILILFTGVVVNFASHSCEGNVVATKVSLTGEVATCGMENGVETPSSDVEITKHCCDNIVSVYSICNNYFPSSFNIEDPSQQVLTFFIIPSDNSIHPEKMNNIPYTTIRPPGFNTANSTSLPALCVFRI
jgi:hypothetical protein